MTDRQAKELGLLRARRCYPCPRCGGLPKFRKAAPYPFYDMITHETILADRFLIVCCGIHSQAAIGMEAAVTDWNIRARTVRAIESWK